MNYIVRNFYFVMFILITCSIIIFYYWTRTIYYFFLLGDKKNIKTLVDNFSSKLTIILIFKVTEKFVEYEWVYYSTFLVKSVAQMCIWKIFKSWIFDHRAHAFHTQIERYGHSPQLCWPAKLREI